ncbi:MULTISPECIES: hemolysin family protein [Pseudonocardia]|uniref:Magnesium and cobalt efflux protein CorC n=2 Tax=Pseudonocardia TaxID=1847 RepID=A0A1Y2N6H7_PSEAH|nr:MULTISPECIES: hemolysin family protein [Pseudonocardia]OSY43085.1 Magnesium and cobalt efflux protein CorC [Pseudonocardia autotrophica]TDN71573.1 CBS domain containing-hemolysin-like protein [Pseudonocardia autotrophica]BBG02262.1 membrane protein [Pseudonocardia autotrophica]GEC23402.1 membrane protein [Pseudonocardia saturnea]
MTTGDLLALLAAIALLGANAFFVAAEFALISARKDRLEAMAEAGSTGARTVLDSAHDLSRMLAASQLGITIASLLLGRLGEPAVAHLIDGPLAVVGVPDALAYPIAFGISLLLVVVAHMLLGEMVPKNIAIAGPERAAIVLVPAFLAWTALARPFVELFNRMANGTLRLAGVTPKDELETAFTSGELSEMIDDARREGLLDDDESARIGRTLASAESTVADVDGLVVGLDDLVCLDGSPTVGELTAAVGRTGFSRFPVRGAHGRLTGYLHVKDVLDLADADAATIPPQRVRALAAVPVGAGLEEALTIMRDARSHLARAVDDRERTVGVVTLEDVTEAFVGTVRDATHAPDARP